MSSCTAPRRRRRRSSTRSARRTDLENVHLYHLHLEGDVAFAAPEHAADSSRSRSSPARRLRKPIAEGRADFLPIFLSDIPALFTQRAHPPRRRAGAALAARPPRPLHARAHRSTRPAPRSTPRRSIIAEINERMPRTLGNTAVPLDRVTAFIHTDRPLPEQAIERGDGDRGPDRRARGRARRRRRDAADGHRRDPRRRPRPPARQARPRHPHRDVLRRRGRSGRVRRDHQPLEGGPPRPHWSPRFVTGTRRLFDFVDDNPIVEFHAVRPHQRHRR